MSGGTDRLHRQPQAAEHRDRADTVDGDGRRDPAYGSIAAAGEGRTSRRIAHNPVSATL